MEVELLHDFSTDKPNGTLISDNMALNILSETTKLHVLIIVGTFVLSLLAFIIALVALTSIHGGSSSPQVINVPSAYTGGEYGGASSSPQVSGDEKVWLLHIGDTDTNIEYINEETGRVEGFNVDIINAVCRIANKNCKLVYDVYSNCWLNVPGEAARGGFGLMAGWYDSCAAWPITAQRARTFQFADPFSQAPAEVFVTLKDNPNGFNWRDLTDKKIGFIDASAVNSHCLATQEGIIQGAVLEESRILHYTDTEQIIAALRANEIDAAFVMVPRSRHEDLEAVSEELQLCYRQGFAMMTRYDSKLIDWWNPAQEKLLASKEYAAICEDVREAHGHKQGQDPADFCIGL